MLAILNYGFIDFNQESHTDAISYLNKSDTSRSEFHKLSHIKKVLDNIDKNLFSSFIGIMVFDALVGQTDRHEENWGIIYGKNNEYRLSPLYDNGSSLLDKFFDKEYLEKFEKSGRNIVDYSKSSKTYIYKEDKSKFSHFELIEYLVKNNYDDVIIYLEKLKNLSNEDIVKIVNAIPKEMLTEKHREYIIKYLKERRDILLSFI